MLCGRESLDGCRALPLEYPPPPPNSPWGAWFDKGLLRGAKPRVDAKQRGGGAIQHSTHGIKQVGSRRGEQREQNSTRVSFLCFIRFAQNLAEWPYLGNNPIVFGFFCTFLFVSTSSSSPRWPFFRNFDRKGCKIQNSFSHSRPSSGQTAAQILTKSTFLER